MLDFARFRVYLADKYGIAKAFVFIGYMRENEPLYNSLRKDGYSLIFKPTLLLPEGGVKGNVDAELVLYAMIEYANYDKALIVTSDGDFYCLVEYLLKQDKLLNLMIPNKNKYSALFRPVIRHIIFMNNLRKLLGH